jgi:UPF0716 protein FxsA
MLPRLIILFTVVPLVELWLLVKIGSRIGALPTVAMVLATGVVGALLARRQGLACLRNARRQLRGGELPTDALLDGLIVLAAAVLLITPGVITDILGIALLIPPVRRRFRRALVKRIRGKIGTFTFIPPGQTPGDTTTSDRDRIIDVRVIDADEDRK